MKLAGKTVRNMVKAGIHMLMVMSMKVAGNTIRNMVKANIHWLMVAFTYIRVQLSDLILLANSGILLSYT
jgi:hypothetical protein